MGIGSGSQEHRDQEKGPDQRLVRSESTPRGQSLQPICWDNRDREGRCSAATEL